MAKTIWGRKETLIWPRHIPIYTYGATCLAIALTGVFVFAWLRLFCAPLQNFYLPLYVRTSVVGSFSATHRDTYKMLFVSGPRIAPRPAMNGDVVRGKTPEPNGKTIPLALSETATQNGNMLLFASPQRSYVDARLSVFLRDVIYSNKSPVRLLRAPLWAGFAAFVTLLPFSVRMDLERQKQLRYGRRLKGPEMLTPRQFNRIVKGDGIGFKTDGMKRDDSHSGTRRSPAHADHRGHRRR